jgi:hypothetical protein
VISAANPTAVEITIFPEVRFHLVLLWVPKVEVAIARVRERVLTGGHSVPEETIRRRYQTGLRNFFNIYRPLATAWHFYDNGGGFGPRSSLEDKERRRQRFGILACGNQSRYNSEVTKKRVKSIEDLFEESTPIEEALKLAVREGLQQHKKLGNPIAVWENGKLVWIPAEEIDPAALDSVHPGTEKNA